MKRTELQKKLAEKVKGGFVRTQKHPTLPLSIYTYTTKTEIERAWDEVTLMCRGLVLDDTGRIIINPVHKFFNQNQPDAADVDFRSSYITVKEDGYMIQIVKDEEYGLVVTSKGSFDSRYAQTARELVIESELPENTTFCCELLKDFPGDEGIIVTRHGDTPSLKCWAIRYATGEELLPFRTIKLPSFLTPVQRLTPDEAYEYLKRKDVEGVVAHDYENNTRIKIKTDEFMKRHKFISGITPKRVWERLRDGETLATMNVPDEFLPTVAPIYGRLVLDFHRTKKEAQRLYGITRNLSDKGLALNTSLGLDKQQKALIFKMRKTGETTAVDDFIWQLIKPKNEQNT